MRKNPLYGGEHKDEFILKAPPVDRLYAIYGINLETEVAYIFKQDNGQVTLDDALSKAQRSQLESEGYVVKKVSLPWEIALEPRHMADVICLCLCRCYHRTCPRAGHRLGDGPDPPGDRA